MARYDPTEFQSTINDFLRRQGWLQPDLARAAGISQAIVNRWMSADPEMLVQPTDPTLRKLSPVIGIDHTELMRLAQRISVETPDRQSREETRFLARARAGWRNADEARRQFADEVLSAILPAHQRRPNRRMRGNNAGLDRPIVDYLMHA